MNEILKFHIEWQERQKCLIKMPSSLIISFIICWLILLCIDFLLLYKEPIHIIGYYALQLFLAFCLWVMSDYFFKVKKAKYKNLIKEYEKLLTLMNDDGIVLGDIKKYYRIFLEYVLFIGIQKDADELEILKKLRKLPEAGKYSEEELKDMVQKHIKTKKIDKW